MLVRFSAMSIYCSTFPPSSPNPNSGPPSFPPTRGRANSCSPEKIGNSMFCNHGLERDTREFKASDFSLTTMKSPCYKRGDDRGCESFFCTGEGEPDSLTPLSPAWERGWGRGVELKLTPMTGRAPLQ